MIELVHNHITTEMQQNARTESIFVLTAVVLNLIFLAINSALAVDKEATRTILILVVNYILVVIVNYVAWAGLKHGKGIKDRLLSGLVQLYKDNAVEKYYDVSLLDSYASRFKLLLMAVAATGFSTIAVPLIILWT